MRPNLLLVTTDQQRWDTIAALGAPKVWTPHLDWLVDTGISFTDAMTDCPVCGPARSTIMTGQHAWRHGETSNRSTPSPMRDLPTLPGLLTSAGYQTRAVGKMHFNPTRAHYGFEHTEILPDYYRWIAAQPGAKPPKRHGVGENEMAPCLASTEEHQTVTAWTVDRAIDFLQTRDPTRPFFLWLSFSKPHPPFDPPRSCWEMTDPEALGEPSLGEWVEGASQAWWEPTYHLNNCHRFSRAQVRAIRRAYAACILHVDQQLGRFLAHLREAGHFGDTWTLFASDHGEMLGDHRMGAKSVFLQGSRRVPLVLRPPGEWVADERAGQRDDRLACLADILPTLLARADVRLPEHATIDGLDLMGEQRRERILGECVGYHAVIERDWAYHWTERGGEELLFRRGPQEEVSASVEDEKGRLRELLDHGLRTRGHRAAGLQATMPVLGEVEARRRLWPGYHTIGDENCDLLH